MTRMNQAEFVERTRRFNNRRNWAGLAVLVGAGAVFLGRRPLRDWGNEFGAPWLPWALIALLLAALWLTGWDRMRRARNAGLACPNCKALLIGRWGELAITTGKCWKCGDQVYDDDPGEADPPTGPRLE